MKGTQQPNYSTMVATNGLIDRKVAKTIHFIGELAIVAAMAAIPVHMQHWRAYEPTNDYQPAEAEGKDRAN